MNKAMPGIMSELNKQVFKVEEGQDGEISLGRWTYLNNQLMRANDPRAL